MSDVISVISSVSLPQDMSRNMPGGKLTELVTTISDPCFEYASAER
jgi:hypothetical protein